MNEEKREQGMSMVKEEVPDEEQSGERNRSEQVPEMNDEFSPLLNEDDADDFRSRWQDIQTGFVDDPHDSVENADQLVSKVMKSITEGFAAERSFLEKQWNQGKEASTEDLRVAMMRYRSFFNRLLSLETPENN